MSADFQGSSSESETSSEESADEEEVEKEDVKTKQAAKTETSDPPKVRYVTDECRGLEW